MNNTQGAPPNPVGSPTSSSSMASHMSPSPAPPGISLLCFHVKLSHTECVRDSIKELVDLYKKRDSGSLQPNRKGLGDPRKMTVRN